MKTIVFDFKKLGSEQEINALKDKLDTITEDISILINNVGVLNTQRLNDVDIDAIVESVSVNVCAQTFMSHFLLPKLLSRQSKSNLNDKNEHH